MRAILSAITLILVGASLLTGSAWVYVRGHTGPSVQATVDKCVTTGHGSTTTTVCTGHWELDGERHSGEVKFTDTDDEGATVAASVTDGAAYAESDGMTLALAAGGLFVLLASWGWILKARKRRAGSPGAGHG